jgi:hypothetical protein
MIIAIDENAANDPGNLRWLDAILGTVEDGWHLWDVTGLEEKEYANSLWITHSSIRGQRIMELYRKSVERGGWSSGVGGGAPHGRRLRVTNEPTTEDELAPEPACRLASERLVILVENRDSDGAFLERVMAELDRPLWRWWSQNPSPAELDDRGGKGQMLNEVRRLEGRNPRPRYVVVVDSDRRKPGDEPSAEAQRLHRACESMGIPCWVLAKREAENYLPRDLLDQRPDVGREHRRQVEAWDRLPEDLKDVYDMKDGFATEDKEDAFAELPEKDIQLLRSGFGDGVGQCWRQHKGQSRQALKARGRGDLERGLSLIRREV